MCNHFTITSLANTLKFLRRQQLPVVQPTALLEGVASEQNKVEIFPRDTINVLLYRDNQLVLTPMIFGYNNPIDESKPPIFNARIERFYEAKPSMWDSSFAKQRCLLIVSRFFESHHSERILSKKTGRTTKQQYQFTKPGSDLFFIAGIYDDGHFALVTTEPNSQVSPIHDRMPLVLEPNEIRTWLFQNFTPLIDRANVALVAYKA